MFSKAINSNRKIDNKEPKKKRIWLLSDIHKVYSNLNQKQHALIKHFSNKTSIVSLKQNSKHKYSQLFSSFFICFFYFFILFFFYSFNFRLSLKSYCAYLICQINFFFYFTMCTFIHSFSFPKIAREEWSSIRHFF